VDAGLQVALPRELGVAVCFAAAQSSAPPIVYAPDLSSRLEQQWMTWWRNLHAKWEIMKW